MLKKTSKLAGLFLLLVLSFVYTDKVFSTARNNDPVMKQVIKYKSKKDVLPTEPVITDDEIILGYSGLVVNEKASYNNMKSDDKFSEEKIVYDKKLPDKTISKTYDYYIKQGNPTKEQVSIVFKVTNDTDVDEVLKMVAKNNVKVSFFVDGAWLENNVETAFSMVNLGCEIYNLGYDGKYDKSMISVTNNLIESISLKDSNFCLNENKDDDSKNTCSKKKMHTITPTIADPSIIKLKENLVKGAIISYDLKTFDAATLSLVMKTITSRGFEVQPLSVVISE
ncbi:MAG: polysaccharide deacetylase family protein [Bacilli bacterium]|nr:polysaccharide deacetylase family protein [Bacilli bacterium]